MNKRTYRIKEVKYETHSEFYPIYKDDNVAGYLVDKEELAYQYFYKGYYKVFYENIADARKRIADAKRMNEMENEKITDTIFHDIKD